MACYAATALGHTMDFTLLHIKTSSHDDAGEDVASSEYPLSTDAGYQYTFRIHIVKSPPRWLQTCKAVGINHSRCKDSDQSPQALPSSFSLSRSFFKGVTF